MLPLARKAWPADEVSTNGETVTSQTNAASGRVSCTVCGGCVANKKPEHGITVVYPMTLSGSGYEFKPGFHLFYSERVMDIADGLPKFIDAPSQIGGSGELIDEPAATGWSG